MYIYMYVSLPSLLGHCWVTQCPSVCLNSYAMVISLVCITRGLDVTWINSRILGSRTEIKSSSNGGSSSKFV